LLNLVEKSTIWNKFWDLRSNDNWI
jgi:hypothetical protein